MGKYSFLIPSKHTKSSFKPIVYDNLSIGTTNPEFPNSPSFRFSREILDISYSNIFCKPVYLLITCLRGGRPESYATTYPIINFFSSANFPFGSNCSISLGVVAMIFNTIASTGIHLPSTYTSDQNIGNLRSESGFETNNPY